MARKTPRRDGKRTSATIALLFVGALLAICLLYDPGYDPVGEEAYRYAIALNTACNQRDNVKLGTLRSMIQDALAKETITPVEHEWLTKIIEDAEQGKWTRAEKQVRRLLEDQVEK